jgi:hypothetical protein
MPKRSKKKPQGIHYTGVNYDPAKSAHIIPKKSSAYTKQLRELEAKLIKSQEVWSKLSKQVGCSSSNGVAELDEVKYIYAYADQLEKKILLRLEKLEKLAASTKAKVGSDMSAIAALCNFACKCEEDKKKLDAWLELWRTSIKDL